MNLIETEDAGLILGLLPFLTSSGAISFAFYLLDPMENDQSIGVRDRWAWHRKGRNII